MYQLDKFEEMDGGTNTRKNKKGHKGANYCREQKRKLWRIINVHFIKRHGREDSMILFLNQTKIITGVLVLIMILTTNFIYHYILHHL